MKPIYRDNIFEKHFKSRITPNQNLVKQFELRLTMFKEGVRGTPINDHGLKGRKRMFRAWSVAGYIRVIYRETDEYYEFLDIGSHNQVY
ncbi:MAG: type II toxin-antitoxin system YafQ family toxin [Patescibacteria group bacterium]|nr:type II toxin-antitoxin system YafQ family toxin [Patescibacteria group bacterium]